MNDGLECRHGRQHSDPDPGTAVSRLYFYIRLQSTLKYVYLQDSAPLIHLRACSVPRRQAEAQS